MIDFYSINVFVIETATFAAKKDLLDKFGVYMDCGSFWNCNGKVWERSVEFARDNILLVS